MCTRNYDISAPVQYLDDDDVQQNIKLLITKIQDGRTHELPVQNSGIVANLLYWHPWISVSCTCGILAFLHLTFWLFLIFFHTFLLMWWGRMTCQLGVGNSV